MGLKELSGTELLVFECVAGMEMGGEFGGKASGRHGSCLPPHFLRDWTMPPFGGSEDSIGDIV